MSQAGLLQLRWRPFGFALPQPLVTAAGTVQQRRGWLLRLQSPAGDVGWGEAAPLAGQLEPAMGQPNSRGCCRLASCPQPLPLPSGLPWPS
jgi:hypothetical protein